MHVLTLAKYRNPWTLFSDSRSSMTFLRSSDADRPSCRDFLEQYAE